MNNTALIKIEIDDSNFKKFTIVKCANGACKNYKNKYCLLKEINLDNDGMCVFAKNMNTKGD